MGWLNCSLRLKKRHHFKTWNSRRWCKQEKTSNSFFNLINKCIVARTSILPLFSHVTLDSGVCRMRWVTTSDSFWANICFVADSKMTSFCGQNISQWNSFVRFTTKLIFWFYSLQNKGRHVLAGSKECLSQSEFLTRSVVVEGMWVPLGSKSTLVADAHWIRSDLPGEFLVKKRKVSITRGYWITITHLLARPPTLNVILHFFSHLPSQYSGILKRLDLLWPIL